MAAGGNGRQFGVAQTVLPQRRDALRHLAVVVAPHHQRRRADATDQLEAWDIAREMSFRIAWKPYMYSQTLPHLLGGVRAPALVLWGEQDKIVPVSAGAAYAKALPGAEFKTIPACGHFAEMEQPEALARLVTDFLAR